MLNKKSTKKSPLSVIPLLMILSISVLFYDMRFGLTKTNVKSTSILNVATVPESKKEVNDNNLIVKMLKLDDSLVKEPLGINAYKVFSNRVKATIYYEKEETEEEKIIKENQIKDLTESIKRREKLLSNENYVNKAPKNIVDMDRQKLEEEKKKLEELLK